MTAASTHFSSPSPSGSPQKQLRILISGAGIAGLGLGFWLRKLGMATPVIIERAAEFQALGHFISLKGNGVEVIRQMGLEAACRARQFKFSHLRMMTPQGKLIRRTDSDKYEQSMGGFIPLRRADLHQVLFDAVSDHIPICYGTEIKACRQSADAVEVEFSDGRAETFDFVFGADGIRSRTRKLVFGEGFEAPLGGLYVAMTANYAHDLKGDHVRFYLGEGQSVHLWPTSPNSVSGIFNYGAGGLEPEGRDTPSIRKFLLMAYEGYSPEVASLLKGVSENSWVFMDTIAQIQMPSIVKGRVALLGDAAHCPTFISGMGSSLALQGARWLALNLAENPDDPAKALAGYESAITPVAKRYAANARQSKTMLLDRRPWVALLRNVMLRCMPQWAMDRKMRRFYHSENLGV